MARYSPQAWVREAQRYQEIADRRRATRRFRLPLPPVSWVIVAFFATLDVLVITGSIP